MGYRRSQVQNKPQLPNEIWKHISTFLPGKYYKVISMLDKNSQINILEGKTYTYHKLICNDQVMLRIILKNKMWKFGWIMNDEQCNLNVSLDTFGTRCFNGCIEKYITTKSTVVVFNTKMGGYVSINNHGNFFGFYIPTPLCSVIKWYHGDSLSNRLWVAHRFPLLLEEDSCRFMFALLYRLYNKPSLSELKKLSRIQKIINVLLQKK